LAAGVYEERRPDISGFFATATAQAPYRRPAGLGCHDDTVYIAVIYVYKETRMITRYTLQ